MVCWGIPLHLKANHVHAADPKQMPWRCSCWRHAPCCGASRCERVHMLSNAGHGAVPAGEVPRVAGGVPAGAGPGARQQGTTGRAPVLQYGLRILAAGCVVHFLRATRVSSKQVDMLIRSMVLEWCLRALKSQLTHAGCMQMLCSCALGHSYHHQSYLHMQEGLCKVEKMLQGTEDSAAAGKRWVPCMQACMSRFVQLNSLHQKMPAPGSLVIKHVTEFAPNSCRVLPDSLYVCVSWPLMFVSTCPTGGLELSSAWCALNCHTTCARSAFPSALLAAFHLHALL